MSFQVISPLGIAIVGSQERIPGLALMGGMVESGTRTVPAYDGETEVCWNGQEQVMDGGLGMYEDEAANEWREDDLVAVMDAQSPPEHVMQVQITGSFEVALDGYAGDVTAAQCTIERHMQSMVTAAVKAGALRGTGLAISGSDVRLSVTDAPERLPHEAGEPVLAVLQSSDGRCRVACDIRPVLALGDACLLEDALCVAEGAIEAQRKWAVRLLVAGSCVLPELARVGRYVEAINKLADDGADEVNLTADIDRQAARAWLAAHRDMDLQVAQVA